MKLNKIFIAALAATTLFASCAKENSTDTNAGTQTIVVSLPDVTTRAIDGQASTGDKTTITANSNVLIFLLNGNSVVDKKAWNITTDTWPCAFEEVSSSINRVIVVANHPSTLESNILAQTSASAIKNYAFTIASQNPTVATGIQGKTLIGDKEGETSTGTHNDHSVKNFDVELSAITARMEIGTVKEGIGVESVELVGIWVNNYRPDGNAANIPILHPYDHANWPDFVSPAASAITPPTTPTYDVPQYYDDADNSNVTLGLNTAKVYAYHVFAGSETNIFLPHVIVLVRGVYKTGFYEGADKYFMGYVTFDKYKEGTTPIPYFAGNNIYKIGLETGLIINAKDITPDPEMEKIDVAVSVSVLPWTERNVTPEVQ